MNFLAHLLLAGEDEGLRVGAMLGDFVRGKQILKRYEPPIRLGIQLHRHIDASTDRLPAVSQMLTALDAPFRRFGGIIIDLIFDHHLARQWPEYSNVPLRQFDVGVRQMLARHEDILPFRLQGFMRYADRRGLFEAYREKPEVLYSLRGIGRRLSRPNPLHRVEDIWDDFNPVVARNFDPVLRTVQGEVADWLKSKSTITGS